MKQILFPTAYTPHAKIAYRYTQKLAQYFNAGITLVHIYSNPNPFPDSELEFVDEPKQQSMMDSDDERWEEELSKLKAFASEMNTKQFHDIPMDYVVTDGNVVVELLEILKQENFDLLVMGMRKRNVISRLFGSTANQLIEKVDCPILLVPPGTTFLHIDKIVYGTAVKFGNRNAIDRLLDWAQAFDASLHMLHLYRSKNKEADAKLMTDLKEEFKPENEAGIITFQMLEGNTKDILNWYTAFQGTVLLAVHWRKQGMLQEIMEGNLTNALVEKATAPLLILK